MTNGHPWNNVDVLIPRRILDNHELGVGDVRQNVTALLDALPTAECAAPQAKTPENLAEADPDACRAWVSRIIRSLPTIADLEAIHGDF